MKPNFHSQISIFILLSFTFVSCESTIIKNEKDSNKLEENSKQTKGELIDSTNEIDSDFKVALVDSIDNEIQRVFVVIDSINMSIIKNAICNILENYQLTERSNISFFTDEKYANHKDEIFYDEAKLYEDENEFLPIEEYKNWLNNYYLAEYELKSKELVLFPSNGKKKKEVGIIDCK